VARYTQVTNVLCGPRGEKFGHRCAVGSASISEVVVYFYVDKGPDGSDVMTRVTETTGGSFRIDYTPTMAGK